MGIKQDQSYIEYTNASKSKCSYLAQAKVLTYILKGFKIIISQPFILPDFCQDIIFRAIQITQCIKAPAGRHRDQGSIPGPAVPVHCQGVLRQPLRSGHGGACL